MTTTELTTTTEGPYAGLLTTSDLAEVRQISTTAVRQGAKRDPLGAPRPDKMALGRGRPWTWNPDREDVKVYLMPPATLAQIAEKIREREGTVSGGARAVGVDRQTFLRILAGDKWSQFTTQLKVVRAAGMDVAT